MAPNFIRLLTRTDAALKAFLHSTMYSRFSIVVFNLYSEQASGWFPIAHQLLPAKAEVAREWIGQRRAGMRGWRDFLKTEKFKLPSGPTIISRRLATNVEHFQVRTELYQTRVTQNLTAYLL